MSDDGLFTMVSLFGAMANGPSNCGVREDGKICTAQGGECRFNRQYYTPGMRDAKSWAMPCANETCPGQCSYLGEAPRDMGTEEERRGRASNLFDDLTERAHYDRLKKKIEAEMLGVETPD